MKYYAKVYTGELTPGEYLTDEQVEKYGEEKLRELCRRGALEAVRETQKAEEQRHGVDRPTAPVPAAPESEEETEEELPELGDAEELVSEEPKAPVKKPARKTNKKRGKEE